jgi:fructose/tagatose bisphosphate aldolase
MLYKDTKNLLEDLKPILAISKDSVEIVDESKLFEALEKLVYNSSLNEDEKVKKTCQWIIWTLAQKQGILPASIHELYMAGGRKEYSGLTVPAINLRGFTYSASQALFRAANKNKVGALIFELARSEMSYTNQPPAEYVTIILAASLATGFSGPVFIQGDHFQIKLKKFQEDPEKEKQAVKDLTKQAIAAGFYNIDVDTSTLVDLAKSSITEQQKLNYQLAAELTAYIRELEPKGITVSVGAEIGEIGGKNSTAEELRTFMKGYQESLVGYGKELVGISKMSVQSGATHGGVVLPDGTIAKVKIDFDTLKTLSKICQDEYGLGGAVQHGASTLPDEAFDKFPETETAEIHLATGFQNIIFDHPAFPKDLRQKMYAWIKENCAKEKKEDWSDEQFIYKLRKKSWGPFKKEIMDLPKEILEPISQDLENKFEFFFKKLNVTNTKDLINKYISPTKIPKPKPF